MTDKPDLTLEPRGAEIDRFEPTSPQDHVEIALQYLKDDADPRWVARRLRYAADMVDPHPDTRERMGEADDLAAKFRCFVSHATGARTDDITLPLNTLSVLATQKVSDAYEAGKASALSPRPAEKQGLAEASEHLKSAIEASAGRTFVSVYRFQAKRILSALRSLPQPERELLREAREALSQADRESACFTLSGVTREQMRRAIKRIDTILGDTK